MSLSVYEQIREAMRPDGTFDESLFISTGRPDIDLTSTPGSMEADILFGPGLDSFEAIKDDDEGYRTLRKMVRMASDGKFERALELAEEFAEKESFIFYRDKLLYDIVDERTHYTGNLFIFGISATRTGRQVETVKIGLALLCLFDTNNFAELKNDIRLLAAYEEFSLYCASIMESWADASEEIFAAAKRVSGWGRVHLIRALKVTNEEMALWLLTDGFLNATWKIYLAPICYEKTNLLTRLLKPMDYEVYRGVAEIVGTLVFEEDGEGIAKIKERGKLLERFLKASSERDDLTGADYRVILDLVDYFERDDVHMPKLEAQARLLLNEDARRVIQKEIEAGESFDIAERLGLSYLSLAYQAVLNDPEKNSHMVLELLEKGYRVDELLGYLEDYIDMDAYGPEKPAGEEDDVFYQDLFTFCLQGLEYHIGKGDYFIRAGLVSWRESLRHRTIELLLAWMNESGKPLIVISPELYEYLDTIRWNEKNYSLAVLMERIIEGDAPGEFEEDPWLEEQLQAIFGEELDDDDYDDLFGGHLLEGFYFDDEEEEEDDDDDDDDEDDDDDDDDDDGDEDDDLFGGNIIEGFFFDDDDDDDDDDWR